MLPRLRTRLSYSECKRSRRRRENKLLRSFSVSLEVVAVPRTRCLHNHLVETPITPNQQRAFEIREMVFPGAGAPDLYTSGYELPNLKDIEFSWKKPQVELHAVFRPGIDTPFSSTAFNRLEMGEGGSSENSIVLDEEKDKEISPRTIAVSERPTETPRSPEVLVLQDGFKMCRNLFIGLFLSKYMV